MSRGTQLSVLRKMLRAEIGDNLTPGVNQADDSRLNQLLFNKQTELASAWDWPFLRDRQDVATVAGTRFYLLPNLDFDRPHMCEVLWNTIWSPMLYGINEDDYNLFNSLQGQTVDPVQKWLIVDQISTQPTTAPDSQTSGTGLTGVYSWFYTVVTAQGESGPSPILTLTMTNNGLIVFPTLATYTVQGVAFAPVTGFNIYRTKANGSVYYFVGNLAASAVAGGFTDNHPDSNINTLFDQTLDASQFSVFEVWPVPSTSGSIRFTGQRELNRLDQDTDCADLDDLLLVYGVAAEECARRKNADTQLKQQKFVSRFNFLKQTGPTAPGVWKMGELSDMDFRSLRYKRRVLIGG